jgi:hypothetical protein
MAYRCKQKGGLQNGSVLREMPRQERDEEYKSHYYEKWQTGHPGHLPNL